MTYQAPLIPKAFIFRRLHSLTGLFLVFFLIEHLFVNSQAALLFGEDGFGFIKSVNGIHNFPYLRIIEVVLLGIPFLIHGGFGIHYLVTGKYNSFSSDGSKPALGQYPRNQAYTWQRITSWILLFAIIGHVVQMRFLEDPASAQKGTQHYYMVRLDRDSGLETLSQRIGFEIFDQRKIQEQKASKDFLSKTDNAAVLAQEKSEHQIWVQALEQRSLNEGQIIAVAKDFGTAELLMVRETFKSPFMIALYTLFVLSACFHGFNGLWTFMISWGVTLTENSQKWMRKIASGLMVLITFFGFAAIWGTYWINLKY